MRKTIDQLAALLIPEVQEIFLRVMQDIVDRAILNEMILAIEQNDADALFRATGFTPAALGPILDAIENAYKEGANTTVDGWPKRLRTPFGTVSFQFNMRNQKVIQDIGQSSAQLIDYLTNEAKDNLRMVMQRGYTEGQNPRATALDIVGRIDPTTKQRVGGIIGLTPNQENWVANGQKYLERLDKKYFNMQLRDKRFDKLILKAMESGKPLSKDQISKIMTAYKTRALRYRAEAIARTETIQSINRGEHMAHTQAVDEGAIDISAITKEWDDVGDDRTRLTHRVLGSKYGKGKGIGLNEPFTSPSGALMMYPGDTKLNAPAGEIVHCRCKARYRIDFLAGVE